jgi:hypothetical protein
MSEFRALHGLVGFDLQREPLLLGAERLALERGARAELRGEQRQARGELVLLLEVEIGELAPLHRLAARNLALLPDGLRLGPIAQPVHLGGDVGGLLHARPSERGAKPLHLRRILLMLKLPLDQPGLGARRGLDLAAALEPLHLGAYVGRLLGAGAGERGAQPLHLGAILLGVEPGLDLSLLGPRGGLDLAGAVEPRHLGFVRLVETRHLRFDLDALLRARSLQLPLELGHLGIGLELEPLALRGDVGALHPLGRPGRYAKPLHLPSPVLGGEVPGETRLRVGGGDRNRGAKHLGHRGSARDRRIGEPAPRRGRDSGGARHLHELAVLASDPGEVGGCAVVGRRRPRSGRPGGS